MVPKKKGALEQRPVGMLEGTISLAGNSQVLEPMASLGHLEVYSCRTLRSSTTHGEDKQSRCEKISSQGDYCPECGLRTHTKKVVMKHESLWMRHHS